MRTCSECLRKDLIIGILKLSVQRGTIQTVQQSDQSIDDIFTEIGTLPSSSSGQPNTAWSVSSRSTIVPSDSASQIGNTNSRAFVSFDPPAGLSSPETLDPLGPNLGAGLDVTLQVYSDNNKSLHH